MLKDICKTYGPSRKDVQNCTPDKVI